MDRENSRKGTTMVEVIVAFTVLLLIFGIFSQAMGLAERMFQRSDDTIEEARELAGGYYLEDSAKIEEAPSGKATLRFRFDKAGGNLNGSESFSVEAKIRTYRYKKGNGVIIDAVPR